MRFTVSPLVLAVSLGLINASALDAEAPEEDAVAAVGPNADGEVVGAPACAADVAAAPREDARG